MANGSSDPVVAAGEQVTTPASALPLKPEEQFRLVNQRLNNLADEVGRIAKPSQFRLADGMNLIAILLVIVLAAITGYGLSERISDSRTDQAASEVRIKDSMGALEVRLGSKLDKLSDQFTAMDERTSRLEGEKNAKPK